MDNRTKVIETKQTVKDQMNNLSNQIGQLNAVAEGILAGVCAEKGVSPQEYGFDKNWNLVLRPPKEKNETPAS
jgi:hypothetical protein